MPADPNQKDTCIMVTLNDAFPSKYLKAADLAGGPVVAIIKLADLEKIKGFDGRETARVVAYFSKKLKPLILNRTNFEAIGDICGSFDSDDFGGTKIELFVQKVSGPNGIVDGVRVRPPGQMELIPEPKKKKPVKSNSAERPSLAEELDDDIPSFGETS
jgi:hypothetical protein